ncbi:MAG: hypothetical protein ACUVV5_08215 [Candidatus Aminicenantales bacterium]
MTCQMKVFAILKKSLLFVVLSEDGERGFTAGRLLFSGYRGQRKWYTKVKRKIGVCSKAAGEKDSQKKRLFYLALKEL